MSLTSSAARWWRLLGALNGFLSVAAGAFGAHALRGRLDPAAFAVFERAADYHMAHALALLLAGLLAPWAGRAGHVAAAAFLAGIVLFCGSLYLLAAAGTRALVWLTPLGGLSLLIGWIALAIAVWRSGAGMDRRPPLDYS